MSEEQKDSTTKYKVVVNQEEQYSVLNLDHTNPLGWRDEGKRGSKEECLAHIKNVWKDQRPKRLREQMEKAS